MGVFKGKLFVKWYVDNKNRFLYDYIDDDLDGGAAEFMPTERYYEYG